MIQRGKNFAPIVVRGVTYENFGAYFRDKRREAALTQEQTAEALGYSERQFISRIETGRVSLPIEKIPAVAEIFKITIQEFAEAVLEEQLRIIRDRINRVMDEAR